MLVFETFFCEPKGQEIRQIMNEKEVNNTLQK